jgi:hypothetical protein
MFLAELYHVLAVIKLLKKKSIENPFAKLCALVRLW